MFQAIWIRVKSVPISYFTQDLQVLFHRNSFHYEIQRGMYFLLYSHSLMYIFVYKRYEECFNFTARYLNFSKPLISILDPCRRWKYRSKYIISFSKLAKNILGKLYKTTPVFSHLYLLQNDFELEGLRFFQLTYILGKTAPKRMLVDILFHLNTLHTS